MEWLPVVLLVAGLVAGLCLSFWMRQAERLFASLSAEVRNLRGRLDRLEPTPTPPHWSEAPTVVSLPPVEAVPPGHVLPLRGWP